MNKSRLNALLDLLAGDIEFSSENKANKRASLYTIDQIRNIINNENK